VWCNGFSSICHAWHIEGRQPAFLVRFGSATRKEIFYEAALHMPCLCTGVYVISTAKHVLADLAEDFRCLPSSVLSMMQML